MVRRGNDDQESLFYLRKRGAFARQLSSYRPCVLTHHYAIPVCTFGESSSYHDLEEFLGRLL